MIGKEGSDIPLRTGPKLHVGGPNIGDREVFDRLVDDIFERRWFTNGGQVVKEFEQQISNHLGVKHCIPVSNATLGLQIVCRALELTGEIVLPAFTFIASPHSVCWERLTPVFADVNPHSHSICPDSVESLITPKTSAIMGVHLWGNPCETERLQAIADQHQLKLIFDAAHAFHCQHDGKMVGNFGSCEVFSFHATKFFNTFEGGAITTNDDQLAEKIRLMTNFGFAGPDRVIHLGINAKMPEVCAAMGISMLGCVDQIAAKNQANFEIYQDRLGNVPGIKLLSLAHLEKTNWQYVVAEIDEHQFGCSRDQALEYLNQNNICAKRYFYPGCHNMEPYRSQFLASGRQLRSTDYLCRRVLCLPTGNSVSPEDLAEVCDVLLKSRKRLPHSRRPQDSVSRKAAG